MKHQNFTAFLHEENKNGVYVFTSDACELCSEFERNLTQYDTSAFTIVEITTIDVAGFSNMFGVENFPYTVVFIDDKIEFRKPGVLFQKQLTEIFNFLKTKGIKFESVKTPAITQLTPVIIEIPSRGDLSAHSVYMELAIKDSILRGESPFCINKLVANVLDDSNPDHRSLMLKVKESWAMLAKKTVVYTDEGISEGMLEGITDAAARNREIEFRKLYEN